MVNTHLFFHPYAPHIRTMHTAAILEEAAAFLQQAAEDPRVGAALGGSRPTVLFCGDLNSDLNDGIPGAFHRDVARLRPHGREDGSQCRYSFSAE